jgi:hypothetical protein
MKLDLFIDGEYICSTEQYNKIRDLRDVLYYNHGFTYYDEDCKGKYVIITLKSKVVIKRGK